MSVVNFVSCLCQFVFCLMKPYWTSMKYSYVDLQDWIRLFEMFICNILSVIWFVTIHTLSSLGDGSGTCKFYSKLMRICIWINLFVLCTSFSNCFDARLVYSDICKGCFDASRMFYGHLTSFAMRE